MKIFIDEFIEAREKFEVDATEAVHQWVGSKGSDSMIECRILSIGDSNKFGDNFYVNPVTYKMNIIDELYNHKINTDEMSRNICKGITDCIDLEISKVIEESTTEVKTLKDVRKCIKVVIDGDFYIKDDLTMYFAFAVEEFSEGMF